MPTLKEQFWDPVAGFGVTFRTMFKKVVTEQYPFEKVPTAPRFHGRHQLNRWPDGLEKCIGCELCAWACPADAIYVEGESNTEDERFSPGERYGRVYQINYLRCILCGLCIEACPTRALTMTNEYELADDNRADLIYTKHELLAPLLPGMEQPPHPMRLGDDEGDYYRGTYKTRRPEEAGDRDRARDWGRPRDRLLHPRADHGAGRARDPVRAQGRARRAAAGGRDDLAGDPLRRPGGAVPLRGADHRLHRRDPDAVPLRADARRRRRLRLGGRDDPRPAAVRDPGRADPRRDPGRRRRSALARQRGRPLGGQQGRQHRGARQHPVLPLRLRLRGHLRAADHRRRGRDGAGAPRAAHPEVDARPSWRPSGSARTPRPACTSARCRPRASSPGTTRSAPRRCCPTAASPRPRSPGCWRPVGRSARHRATSRRCSARSTTPPTRPTTSDPRTKIQPEGGE